MSEELRCYIVRAEVRDDATDGTARLSVIARGRAEAISRARAHVRTQTATHNGRITKLVSARLAEAFRKKGAHS